MDERDSHCPYLLSSETTAKGTGLAESAGKEDPVELKHESSHCAPCCYEGQFQLRIENLLEQIDFNEI